MRSLRLLSLVVAAVFLTAPMAAHAKKPKLTPSKYRKVNKGVGNCVFSAKRLKFEKEKEYEVAAGFSTGQTVYARCYYPKQLQHFGKKGKLHNELRDDRTYRIKLEMHAKAKKKRKKKKKEGAALPTEILRVKQDGEEEWDQREYDLDPNSKRCLFKSHLGTTGCLDFDRAMRELAMLDDKPLPYTGEVCLTTWVEHANKQKGQAGSGTVEREMIPTVITSGCFDFTAKGEGKWWKKDAKDAGPAR
jgi:hypothetical protein